MSEPIVSFAAPPVAEVVAGFSLGGLSPNFSPLIGAYWRQSLRARFPVLQQQPPYTPPEELVGERRALPNFGIEFGADFPSPRLWASTEDGNDLLQLQVDWFAQNWRRVKPDDEYDRWLSRREALQASFTEFRDYCQGEGIPAPSIRQCELSYINHIPMSDFQGGLADLGEVIIGQSALSAAFPLEQASIQSQYLVEHHGRSAGRLHVNVSPGLNSTGQPMYVLELTVRSTSDDYDLSAALDFLDRGREVIDLTFRDLTSETMHQKWGML